MFSSLFAKLATWLRTRALNPGAKNTAKIDKVLGDGAAEAITGAVADAATQAASQAVADEAGKVKL